MADPASTLERHMQETYHGESKTIGRHASQGGNTWAATDRRRERSRSDEGNHLMNQEAIYIKPVKNTFPDTSNINEQATLPSSCITPSK